MYFNMGIYDTQLENKHNKMKQNTAPKNSISCPNCG